MTRHTLNGSILSPQNSGAIGACVSDWNQALFSSPAIIREPGYEARSKLVSFPGRSFPIFNYWRGRRREPGIHCVRMRHLCDAALLTWHVDGTVWCCWRHESRGRAACYFDVANFFGFVNDGCSGSVVSTLPWQARNYLETLEAEASSLNYYFFTFSGILGDHRLNPGRSRDSN